MNNGPSIKNIPAQSFKVCDGCVHLNKVDGMRGHKMVTDTYLCNHPDHAGVVGLMGEGEGKLIYYRHSDECITPQWCPIVKSKIKNNVSKND